MPQAIAAAGAFVVNALTATGITGFIARVAATVLLSAISSKLFGPKFAAQGITGHQITTRGALEYRKIVYGQAMVSGPVVYNNVSGTNNENLWYLIALTGHESEDVVSVWLDGDEILKADIAWTAGAAGADGTGSGAVSTAKYVGENSTTALNAFYYLGHDNQVVSAVLDTEFSDWGVNNRLRGVSYLLFKLVYVADTEKVWEQGAPSNFKAVIKGRKIYDPRLDSTNGGTGTQRYTDSTTWAWSENPALCVADYLMTYMGVDPATSINWTSVTSSANDCEILAAIPTASTESRFTCNGVMSTGQTHKDNLDSLLSSMDGKLSYSGGVWTVRASVWEASSQAITADDLAGPVEVRGSAPKSERFNTIRGNYADPARKYESVEFLHVTNSTYITRDNGETIPFDLELPFTNSEFMCQRIAIRNVEQGNNQVIANLTLNAMGAKIAVGDVVDVTLSELSWSAKTFRVIEWRRNPDATYGVVLREDQSASYTDPLESAYSTRSASGVVTVPADVVPAPSGLTATAITGGIRLSWTNPPSQLFEWIDVYESATSAWSAATLINSVRASTLDVLYPGSTTRFYWVRARNLDGQLSLRDPNSDTSAVTATSTGGGGSDGNSVFVANIYKRSASAPATPAVDDGSYDFSTNTLTPAAGWSATFPAGTDPLYVSTGSFSVVGQTGVDSTVTWTAPDKLVQDGATGATGSTGSTGATGGDGSSVHVANIYLRANAAPSTPAVDDGSYNFTTQTLTPPSGWSTTPPAGSEPLYVSTGVFSVTGTTGTDSTVTWTSPDLLLQDGNAGSSALNVGRRMDKLVQWWANDGQSTVLPVAQWSVISGSGGPVTDNAFRVEGNDATSRNLFSERMAIDNTRKHRVSLWARQPVGNRNNYLLVAFYDSAGASINGGTSGATGWSSLGSYFYHSKVNGDFPTAWTKYTFEFGGDAGATIPSTAVTMAIGGLFNRDGTNNTQVDLQDYKVEELSLVPITSQLTNPAHVVDAANDGTGYSLTGAGGTHQVAEGTTDRTSAATHSITGGATKNGLTISVTSAGVYSLSGAGWTSDSETFTLRSVYGGVTNDKVYTISKAKQGATGGSGAVQLAGKALVDSSTTPTDSEVGYQLQSTGLERSYTGIGNPYITIADWLLSGAAGDYECMLTVNSGTAPAGSVVGSWLNLGTVRSWTLTDTSSIGGVISNNCTIQIRLASTQTVKASATVTMSVEESV